MQVKFPKHGIGTRLYAVAFRRQHTALVGDDWMLDEHPAVPFEHGLCDAGVFGARLPRLYSPDFELVSDLLSSDLVIERFVVVKIVRSPQSRLYYYMNQDGEWMPEWALVSNRATAKREAQRIKCLIRDWAVREDA